MFGVVTRSEEETAWDEFDRAFYEAKDVTGRARDPIPGAVNMLSCFADNQAEDDEDIVPVDEDGNRATRERPYFDWSYVCPTHEAYREGLLAMVEDAVDVTGDVRLDDVGFPRQEYCHCERCREAFAESEHDDREDWRASVITDFVADARERVPGRLFLTVYPDPYPGHLKARSGVDLEALAPLVDEFVIPLYDTAYGTTYWLEILASAFADRLETPVSIELYAANVPMEELSHAAEVAAEYADWVLFGYDAANARAAIRRARAETNEGETHRPS